ncbi:unnamed protein product, partial [Microthlaspi erraticum]
RARDLLRNRPAESDDQSFSGRSVSDRFSGLLATSQPANHPRRRDPNTSPDHSIGRSDGRQIAPPTKNGHAPPPIESRKSSQSVNPYYVWTCAGGTTRPVKARSVSPTEGTSRPELALKQTSRPIPRFNYELFNCNNLNIRYWSWNYRGCWHQTCPPMDPPVSQAPSPESNPNSPSPVTTMANKNARTTAGARQKPRSGVLTFMPTKERSSDVHAKPSIKGSDVHANPAQATTLAIIVNPAKATTPTFTQNPTQARRNKDLTVIFCPWDKRAMAGPNCFTHRQ